MKTTGLDPAPENGSRPDSTAGRATRRGSRVRLATALSAAAVAFAVLAVLATADEPTRLDSEAEALAREHEADWLVWLAGGPLDLLGEPGVVAVLAGAAALVLGRLGRWRSALVLVLALTLAGFGGVELKETFDRARPATSLDDASNPAFPSGHARFSVFWTWLAVVVATHRRLIGSRRWLPLLALGVTVTLLVGLARVYLRAHWLTDVLAGWALSAFCFALAAAVITAAAGIRARREGLPPRGAS